MNSGGRPKMGKEEQYSARINLRLTQAEYNLLLEKKTAHYSISDFVRGLIFNKRLPNVNVSDLKKYVFELNKIGNNVNQISKNINTSLILSDADKHKLLQSIAEINLNIEKVYSELSGEL